MDTTLTAPTSAAAVATTKVATASRRWTALDLFRFAAVILMVQGHTFNVLVMDTARDAVWYRWHNYVHGYTAPMFMFAAGLAFGITTFRRWDDHAAWGRPVFKRIERYLLIIGIGYLLHLPNFSVSAFHDASEAELRNFLKVDALQLIGLTMLGCELLVVALRRRRAFVAVSGILGTAIVLLAPFIWRLPIEDLLHPALAGYVNDHTGSIFPIFPWAGFIFAGIVAAHVIQETLDKGRGDELTSRLLTIGSALLLGSLLLDAASLNPFGEHNFWKTSPWFFYWRVGIVLCLIAALSGAHRHLRRRREAEGGPSQLSLLQIMGQETLVIYVAHLILLYGSPVHMGFHRAFGRELTVLSAAFIFLGIFALMAGFAWAWHRLKRSRPSQFQVGRLIFLAAVIAYAFGSG